MTATITAAAALRPRLDLRTTRVPDVLAEVERALGTPLRPVTAKVKRRSIGMATERGTWVRIEARATDRLFGQSPDGVEVASRVAGVARPAWLRGASWEDRDRAVVWRVDETELVAAEPVKPGGILTVAPDLPDSWWQAMGRSLSALAASSPSRVATVDSTPITQERVSEVVAAVFGDVDTEITMWGGVHADLNWANVTAPELSILDWEDYGRGPVGLDHAGLWAASLAVEPLAEWVEAEFADVLSTPTGRVCQLFFLAELLSVPADYAGALRVPAEAAADRLLSKVL